MQRETDIKTLEYIKKAVITTQERINFWGKLIGGAVVFSGIGILFYLFYLVNIFLEN